MDLDALRARIAEILERLEGEGINALSDEELAASQDELLDCFNAARGLGGSDGLAEATRCREGIVQVREEKATRAEESARLAAEFDRLAEEVAPEPEPEAEAEPEAESVAEAETAEAEDAETDDGGTGTAGGEAAAAEAEPEAELVPVAAGVATAPPSGASGSTAAPSRGASVARVAAAKRATIPAAPRRDERVVAKFTFAEDGRAVPKNRREISEAIGRVHERWSRTTGVSMNIPVLHAEWEYPEHRNLSPVASAPDVVTRIMEDAVSPPNLVPPRDAALTAAGGICAPFPIDYNLLNVSEDVRPVAAALPSFQAPRGGIQFMPSYVLSDVTADVAAGTGAAVAKITRAQDAAGSPSKPCQSFTCKTVTSCEVYAITRCVKFGNWNARFYPELIDNIMAQVTAVQARFAEELLLQAIGAGSIQVDFNGYDYNGATASLLAAVGRASRRLRHANRAPGATIRVAFPNWVVDLIREDMSSRLANGNEQFAIADAWWNQQLALRNVSPWYFIDGENDIQELRAPVGPGGLLAFPNTVVFYMYFEGAWTFLDGGTLDLGIVRDSVLNPANDFQMFAETWEGLCNRGLPSLRINATVCPNGASAGTFAPFACGS